MATITTPEAVERLASGVEKSPPDVLPEICEQLFGTTSPPGGLVASELARHIRGGLGPEEVVDLWAVVFPADRNVWYNEATGEVHLNEEVLGHAGW